MHVIYNIASTVMVGPMKNGQPHSAYARTYKSEKVAERVCGKMNARVGGEEYAVATEAHYMQHVVKMVERTNLMSGAKYMEPSNTPSFMSASSESYWSN